MLGSPTTPDPAATAMAWRPASPSGCVTPSASGFRLFRGSMAACVIPRRRPSLAGNDHGRGRCDSLRLIVEDCTSYSLPVSRRTTHKDFAEVSENLSAGVSAHPVSPTEFFPLRL